MGNIQLIQGDITHIETDAIVNAANASLSGGGGVDGAIHRAGGPEIMEACKKIGGCPTGEAVITTAGRLPAKFVIHTVGPVWNGGKLGEPSKLASCYRNSLKLAHENKISSIAFPNISTGVYGYPKMEAASIAISEVQNFLAHSSLPVTVQFVCYDDENFQIYQKLLEQQ